jgi:hypothetical protein
MHEGWYCGKKYEALPQICIRITGNSVDFIKALRVFVNSANRIVRVAKSAKKS